MAAERRRWILILCQAASVICVNLTSTSHVTTSQASATRTMPDTSTYQLATKLSTATATSNGGKSEGYCKMALSVEHIECDNHDYSQVLCLEQRARVNLSKNGDDAWVIYCTFHTPEDRGEIMSKGYKCVLTEFLGHVTCTSNESNFTAQCQFTMFFCQQIGLDDDVCEQKMQKLYEDGGECGANDNWCPKPNFYSLNKYIFTTERSVKFGDLKRFQFKAPSHCMAAYVKVAAIVGAVVAVIVIVAFIVLVRKIKPVYMKYCDPKHYESTPVVQYLNKLLVDEGDSPKLTEGEYFANDEEEAPSTLPPPSETAHLFVNNGSLLPPAVRVSSGSSVSNSGRNQRDFTDYAESGTSSTMPFLNRPSLPHENIYQGDLLPTTTSAHFRVSAEKCDDSGGLDSGNPRSVHAHPSTSSQSSFVNPGYMGFNNYTVYQTNQQQSDARSYNRDDEVFHGDVTSGESSGVNIDNPGYV